MHTSRLQSILKIVVGLSLMAAVGSCNQGTGQYADLILTNGRVYTYAWSDPLADGAPAADAPFENGAWQPNAGAIAVKDGIIIAVGSQSEVDRFRDAGTRVVDVGGATILPGLVESHCHVEGIGANLEKVDLTDVKNEAEAVERIVKRAESVPKGEWIVGRGWDEGAWADRYPNMRLLTERVPDHPVVMGSLHGFAVWGNRLAFEKAAITGTTQSPVGGEIVKDKNGNPTGLLMNNATDLLTQAVPPPSQDQIKKRYRAGFQEMIRSGYVTVHLAGVREKRMRALEELDAADEMNIRVYAMIAATDEALMQERLQRGPDKDASEMLVTRSVKAFYDGALGSRGARLLEDYSDRPGLRGVSGENYGFDQDLVAKLMAAGFQVGIHAIGDAGNRETLDFLEKVFNENPETKDFRHRIEHAQVVHPDDFDRFASMDIIASMEPPHAVEDKTWAEERLGPERIKGAYAWRTLRQKDVMLIFNSDLTGSDHDIFYGLHSAITRRSKDLQPPEGWYPEQAMTPEEAVRAYAVWPAYAAFREEQTGTLETGKWADITVLSIDPHQVALEDPDSLLNGKVLYTIIGGEVIYEGGE